MGRKKAGKAAETSAGDESGHGAGVAVAEGRVDIPAEEHTEAAAADVASAAGVVSDETAEIAKIAGGFVTPACHATIVNVEDLDTGTVAGDERYNDAAIADLGRSLRALGQLQEIGVVGPVDGHYTVLWGRRRVLAARAIGLKDLRARAFDKVVPEHAEALEGAENMQREDWNVLQESRSVCRIYGIACEKLRVSAEGVLVPDAVNQVAAVLGKSGGWVRDRLWLRRATGKLAKAITEGRLSLRSAREICKLADPQLRDDAAGEFSAMPEEGDAEASFDLVKDYVASRLNSLAVVPWRTDVVVPGVSRPACDDCEHNTKNAPSLFEHVSLPDADERVGGHGGGGKFRRVGDGPYCLLGKCYEQKRHAVEEVIKKQAARVFKEAKDGPISAKRLEDLNLVPAAVNPETFTSAVKAIRREKDGPTASNPAGANGQAKAAAERKRIEQTPEEKAKGIAAERHRKELDEWATAASKSFARAIENQKPGLKAALGIILDDVGWDLKEKRSETDVLKAVFAVDLKWLDKEMQRQYGGLFINFGARPEWFVAAVNRELKLNLKPRPSLDAIQAEELAKLTPKNLPDGVRSKVFAGLFVHPKKPAGKKSKKAPAPKGKKKKAQR